jgi:hypothetical protein
MQSSRSNAVLLLVAGAMLSGCADYLNRRDSVTLGAGNAPAANTLIQTVDPWPDSVMDTNIIVSGDISMLDDVENLDSVSDSVSD